MQAIHSHTPGHIANVVARGESKRVQIFIGMGPESASHSLSNHPEDVQGGWIASRWEFSLRLPKVRHQDVEAEPARLLQMMLIRRFSLANKVAADVHGRASIHCSLRHPAAGLSYASSPSSCKQAAQQ